MLSQVSGTAFSDEQDIFGKYEACRVVDAKFLKPVSADEAVALLTPCMKELSMSFRGVKISVTLELDYVARQNGLFISVESKSWDRGHAAYYKLEEALEKRNEKLMGISTSIGLFCEP